jgi:hypothetical protein
MIRLLIVLYILLTPCIVSAGYIDLPQDAEGWTVFTPSSDTDVVYISADGDNDTCRTYRTTDVEMGSNPFEPDGAILPCATYAKAYSLTSTNSPDWVLFKRGDTFTDVINKSMRSGVSETEPFLIGAYGTSGNVPVLQTGAADALDFNLTSLQYVVIANIDFYAHNRDPDSDDYVGTAGQVGLNMQLASSEVVNSILIEGCKFRYYLSNELRTPLAPSSGYLTLRRNYFGYQYSADGHSQGLYSYKLHNVLFEENIFYHNGWLVENYTGTQDADGGQATFYNHSFYLTSPNYWTIKNNIIIESSCTGVKFTSTGVGASIDNVVTGNLILGGENGVDLGNNNSTYLNRFEDITVANNVLTNLGMSRLQPAEAVWGLWLDGWNGGSVSGNLVINTENPLNYHVKGITIEDSFVDVSITDNTIYNMISGIGIEMINPSAINNVSGVTFSGNIVDLPSSDYAFLAAYANSGKYAVSGNAYYGAPDTSFSYLGSSVNYASWAASTGDTSTVVNTTFTDDTRDVDTYNGSIGGTATIAGFIADVIEQDRYNWDSRYEAETINTWIMAGFDMAVDAECDSSHRYLCTVDDCSSDGGGYWYNDTCNEDVAATCETDITECDNATDCNTYWSYPYYYDNACQTTAEEEEVIPTTSSSGAVYGAGYSQFGAGYMILQED